jgi:hypothetical protein
MSSAWLGFSCMLGALGLLGCVGTSGGELFEFEAYAVGIGSPDETLTFTNSRGYAIELTRAELYVGGVYLNRSRPTSVSNDTSCTLPGIYTAQVLEGREIDLLSSEQQRFPGVGFAAGERAATAEVWLTRGDVNAHGAASRILGITGVARRDGAGYPFEGEVSIGDNRRKPIADPAQPGAAPICKERIVTPIRVDFTPRPGGNLLLRIDPRGMFANVDFATLSRTNSDGVWEISDADGVDQASDNVYRGLRSSSGVYELEWKE